MDSDTPTQNVTASDVVNRSRKANRRTLIGCNTQLDRVQQQIRNVGMQYSTVKPEILQALSNAHDVIDSLKEVLDKTGNNL